MLHLVSTRWLEERKAWTWVCRCGMRGLVFPERIRARADGDEHLRIYNG